MLSRIKNWSKTNRTQLMSWIVLVTIIGLATTALFPSARNTIRDTIKDAGEQLVTVGTEGLNKILTIGMEDCYAAVEPDYTCDGTADDAQVQAALTALSSSGGEIHILAGTYNFTATVSRAIDDVTVRGVGKATYIAYNGSTALFSAGSQDGWTFADIAFDAGGITLSSATNYVLDNVWVGDTHYTDTRTASYVVAASDAPSIWQAQADYVSNGTSTDEEFINAALTALPSSGGKVFLSEGTFTIDGSIVMNDYDCLIGAGEHATQIVLKNTQTNVPMITTYNVSSYNDNAMQIELAYMTIDGNKDNQSSSTTSHGLWLSPWDSHIHNLIVKDTYNDAVNISGSSVSTDDNLIEQIRVIDPDGRGIIVGAHSSSPKTTVKDCIISGFASAASMHGIHAIGWAQRILDNTIYCNMTAWNAGIYVEDSNGSIIDNNYVEVWGGSNTYGIGLVASGVDNYGNIISNNMISTVGSGGSQTLDNGIRLSASSDTLYDTIVEGNVIYPISTDTVNVGIYINANIVDCVVKNNNLAGGAGTVTTALTNASNYPVVIKDNIGYATDSKGMCTLVVASSEASEWAMSTANYICDGTADDVEINTAIGVLQTNNEGGTIVLSEGNFNLSAAIEMDEEEVWLVGQGWGTVLTKVASDNMIEVTAADCHIEDMYLEGAGSSYTGYGVYITGASDRCTVRNLNISNSEDNAIRVDSGSVWNWIINCRVRNCFDNSVVFSASNENHIIDSLVGFNDSSVRTTKDALVLSNAENCLVRGNLFDACRYGIQLYGTSGQESENNRIVGNQIEYMQEDGIHIGNYCNYNIISDNIVRDNSKQTDNTYDGISIEGDYNTISDNVVYESGDGDGTHGTNNEKYYIYLASGITGNTITNNDIGITSADTANMIDASSNVTNIIKDNKGYIAKGEIRQVWDYITAGVQNTVTAIQNPELQDCVILEAYVYISVADPDDSPTYDMGTDDDGSGTPSVANNLFEAIPDTVGYYSSIQSATGQQTVPVTWNANGGANDYVNFIITDDDGDGTSGTIYIKYMGR